LALIQPGKPQQNAFAESFVGGLRDERLNGALFSSPDEARAVLAAWWEDYNCVRTHVHRSPTGRQKSSGATAWPFPQTRCQGKNFRSGLSP
jgi:hypothetical protein